MMRAIDEKAVSEVIGVVLLISVTVLGVAIVAVTFLSQPAPSEIPHVSVVAGATNTTFVLSHEGGDALAKGSYRIYVDNGSGLEDRTDEFILTGGNVWSIGKNLTYTGTGTPQRVVISAISLDGGETMIAELAHVADMVDAGAVDAGGYVDTGGNESGSDPDPDPDPDPEPSSFIDYVIDENVFVYGNVLKLGAKAGGSSVEVTGPRATVVITGGLDTEDLKGNSFIDVSNIYIDGNVTLNDGSNRLGSPTEPGYIVINGDLMLMKGNMHFYGDIYVNGDCDLAGVTIYDNVYVNGDLTLRREQITFENNAHVYYTGVAKVLEGVDSSKLEKCTRQTTVPTFTMPDLEIPSTKSADWYATNNYSPGGTLTSNMKVFADSYLSDSGSSASNVIIIASDGDISITNGWSDKVTGVFFAPKGKVTFNGKSLEGVVIARDGFFVVNGGSEVTFKNIAEYISDPDDYPF